MDTGLRRAPREARQIQMAGPSLCQLFNNGIAAAPTGVPRALHGWSAGVPFTLSRVDPAPWSQGDSWLAITTDNSSHLITKVYTHVGDTAPQNALAQAEEQHVRILEEIHQWGKEQRSVDILYPDHYFFVGPDMYVVFAWCPRTLACYKPSSMDKICDLLRQVMKAVTIFNKRGIVCINLTPHNILCDVAGCAKVRSTSACKVHPDATYATLSHLTQHVQANWRYADPSMVRQANAGSSHDDSLQQQFGLPPHLRTANQWDQVASERAVTRPQASPEQPDIIYQVTQEGDAYGVAAISLEKSLPVLLCSLQDQLASVNEADHELETMVQCVKNWMAAVGLRPDGTVDTSFDGQPQWRKVLEGLEHVFKCKGINQGELYHVLHDALQENCRNRPTPQQFTGEYDFFTGSRRA